MSLILNQLPLLWDSLFLDLVSVASSLALCLSLFNLCFFLCFFVSSDFLRSSISAFCCSMIASFSLMQINIHWINIRKFILYVLLQLHHLMLHLYQFLFQQFSCWQLWCFSATYQNSVKFVLNFANTSMRCWFQLMNCFLTMAAWNITQLYNSTNLTHKVIGLGIGSEISLELADLSLLIVK